jgi:glyoxylase-like metal-dependent hydrolase (beta-lactamase superfamily II)
MALEEIFPFIYGLRMAYVNAFLLTQAEGLILIDSGLPNRKETILRALSEIRRSPKELKHIAITHHHVDHTGSLAALVEASGADVWVHPLDAPIVRGEKPVPGPNPKSILGKIVEPVVARLPAYRLTPAQVDHEVADGEELPAPGGMKTVHTPGHTAGHVSYLVEGHGTILFAGDAAGNLFGRLGLPLAMYTEDMAEAKRSLGKLAELEFEAACFGHGGVLKGKANVAFRRLVERLAR